MNLLLIYRYSVTVEMTGMEFVHLSGWMAEALGGVGSDDLSALDKPLFAAMLDVFAAFAQKANSARERQAFEKKCTIKVPVCQGHALEWFLGFASKKWELSASTDAYTATLLGALHHRLNRQLTSVALPEQIRLVNT